MGTGEESTTPKPSKPASSTQEVPTTLSYHDWASPVQAYYGAGTAPPPFFASTVTSPTPPPYIWGGQHHLIPPYGTPVPYPAIYPSGAIYAHPNMASTLVPAQAAAELEGKGSDVKDGLSAKKSKGNSGNSVAKTGDGVKATSGSGNDGASQSGESSEGSSDGNEDYNQQAYSSNKKGSFDRMLADGANAQNNSVGGNIPVSVTGKPIGTAPATTNLNIGMDFRNSSTAAGAAKMGPNPASAAGTIVATGVMADQWTQDERELKRQRRKQSNRESARRSRLRKQAECEKLQARVENLSSENCTLRDELQRLSEECEKLTSENSSIKEELTRLCGPEVLANLQQNSNSATDSHQNEGDS